MAALWFASCNGIRNPESREIFMLESGIQDIFYVGIRNPVSWNPESTKVLESGIYFCRNPLLSNCFGRFFYFSTQSPFSGPPLTLLPLRHSKHVLELFHAGHTPPRGEDIFLMTSASNTCNKKDARRFARWRFRVLASEVFWSVSSQIKWFLISLRIWESTNQRTTGKFTEV